MGLQASSHAPSPNPTIPPHTFAAQALSVRGGSSIGPVDADMVVKISAAFGVIYFIEMFFMTEKAGAKYWGARNQPGNVQSVTMTKWFGLSILNMNIITMWMLNAGASAVELAKASTITWALAAALYFKHHKIDGLLTDGSGLIVQAAMLFLCAYTGFF